MIKIRNHKTYRIADRLRAIGKQVSDSLIRIVRGLNGQPRYLVAKGGTAPSDVATRGLGGFSGPLSWSMILPGAPVWKQGSETRHPGMAYIVFHGNVDDDDALAVIQGRLTPGI